MKNLFRGILFGLLIIPIIVILLAVIGACSLLLLVGLIRYIQLDIKKDGLKNAKPTSQRFRSRRFFNRRNDRMGEDS